MDAVLTWLTHSKRQGGDKLRLDADLNLKSGSGFIGRACPQDCLTKKDCQPPRQRRGLDDKSLLDNFVLTCLLLQKQVLALRD